MKYMLLVYRDERAVSDIERQELVRDSAQLARDLTRSGQYIDASPLQTTSTATSVRLRGGKRLITDGPFAETREQLGGYYLIDAKDLDGAIEVASRVPAARIGTIEIRPLLQIPGLPAEESGPGRGSLLKKL